MSRHFIHVFISHSWTYAHHYNTLKAWIFDDTWRMGQASLIIKDFSIPLDDPIHGANSDAALRRAILGKIKRSHVVVIPTGMYVNHSKWIKKEIRGASKLGKPVLGVNPWGQRRTSSVVGSAANLTVGWNRKSVVKAIWALYRR